MHKKPALTAEERPGDDGMTMKMRLALLFTALVGVILGGFAWLTYAGASYQRAETFFSALKANGIATATVVLRSDNLSDREMQPFRKKVMHKLSQESIEIFKMDKGRYFQEGDRPIAITDAEREHILASGILELSRGDVQQVCFPFQDEDQQYIVAISAVDEAGLKTLAKVRWTLMLAYVVSLLIVFASGKWFASKAIAPLADITRQAERISASDLHVRVKAGPQKDELFQLAQAFNGMLDRLDQAFLTQKQFIANASHELRTPLTTMEGQLEVTLMKRRQEAEYRATIAGALDEARALRRMTNNLLLLTKVESVQPAGEGGRCRLDEALFAALEEAKQRYPDRAVTLEYASIPDDEARLQIRGNEDLVRHALLNLIENAFKYSRESAPVKVTMGADDGHLSVRIADQGVGIPSEDMPHIFDPFYRSTQSKSVPGSGVGLTLVKAIVERHRGRIQIESVPEMGTSVVVTFPLAA